MARKLSTPISKRAITTLKKLEVYTLSAFIKNLPESIYLLYLYIQRQLCEVRYN